MLNVNQEDRWTPRTLGVLFACGIGNVVSSTAIINCSFSAFLIPVTRELGWARSQFSIMLTIISVAGLAAYPLAGRLMDRFGARPVILIGNLSFGLLVMLASRMTAQTREVYPFFAILGVAAAMPSTVLLARVASSWFHQQRGLALGLSAGVALGIGGTTMPLFSQAMIDRVGWRGAYIGLGAIVILLGFPVMFALLRESQHFARTGPRSTLTGVTFKQAIRSRPFWLLLSSVALGAGSLTAVATHIHALIAEHGLAADTGAWAIAAMSTTNAIWQIALGRVLDRSKTPRVAAPFLAVAILGVLLLERSSNGTMVIIAAALMGIGSGTEYGLLPYCMPRYFGFRFYGSIYGWIFGATMLITGLMPFLMDVLFERLGSYGPVMYAIALGLFGCALLIRFLPHYRYSALPEALPAHAPAPTPARAAVPTGHDIPGQSMLAPTALTSSSTRLIS